MFIQYQCFLLFCLSLFLQKLRDPLVILIHLLGISQWIYILIFTISSFPHFNLATFRAVNLLHRLATPTHIRPKYNKVISGLILTSSSHVHALFHPSRRLLYLLVSFTFISIFRTNDIFLAGKFISSKRRLTTPLLKMYTLARKQGFTT